MSRRSNRACPGTVRDPRVLLLVAAIGCVARSPVAAQGSVERLWSDCGESAPALVPLCADAALAVQALHDGIGLEMTGGGALPSSPSTAGQRMPGSPRVIADLGVSWASFRYPDLSRSPGASGFGDERSLLAGLRLTGVAGIFDGISLVPGVAGVLALDGVGIAQWVRAPASPASPSSGFGWGGGVRIGIVRESFSMPGITVSGVVQQAGELRFGTLGGTGALAFVDPFLTSTRLTAGKELWPVGLSIGIGWDRYRGRGRIEARLLEGTSGSVTVGRTRYRELSTNRRYLFGGVNFTWVVTQIAAELTWARETSPLVNLEGTRPFEPGGTDVQGALTFRVTY